jgi:hypothetical protein
MTDTPQQPDAGAQEGGYGFPTLEQEVTPDVLKGGAESERSGDAAGVGTPSAENGGDDDGPTPGELEEHPSAVEPTD